MQLKITDVRIRIIDRTPENKMKAVASITIDEEFVIHDLKVIDGSKGLFVAMPSKKDGSGEYVDTAHPINTEVRESISNQVLEAYKTALEENGKAAKNDSDAGESE